MNDLRKVLVVDSGARGHVDPLAAELAELGLSSVTTSFEAADQVLNLIDRPSAIFLNMPSVPRGDGYDEFLSFAESLRARGTATGVPVIVWDHASAFQPGRLSTILQSELGPQVLSEPEL